MPARIASSPATMPLLVRSHSVLSNASTSSLMTPLTSPSHVLADSMDWIPLPKPTKKMRPRLHRPAPLYFSHKRVSTLMTLARADVQEAEQGFTPNEAPTRLFHRLNRALIDAVYQQRGTSTASNASFAIGVHTCAHEDRAPAVAARVSGATVLSNQIRRAATQVDPCVCISVVILALAVCSMHAGYDLVTLLTLLSILAFTLCLA
ncbi:hypothetical protein EXIGLDRAFT_832027 [Exidia glandulosa HHB12029]|uniref:Uncharacterized protein n=1 Tax=Exidia glandulosa HHB12029 TaxID=1314781 RepID=A0A165M6F7_EXIGL|nr:hypothetical protein EXIGLDRAFT_832027 [Exidia glandulosa HHB12029]